MNEPDIIRLQQGVEAGDRRSIGQSITLIESYLKEHRPQAEALLAKLAQRPSLRIGISGIPGVGKSTFIETFGKHILSSQPAAKLAVLAVDPSSPKHGGSILGDKTRMQDLSSNERVFIRPSPSGVASGGTARHTRESIRIMEAAGYEYVLVETVGAGQGEHMVAGMVDVFLLLQMPSTGDSLQGMKKGSLELADLIVVNKSDGDLVEASRRTKRQLEGALALTGAGADCGIPIILTSATTGSGIEATFDTISSLVKEMKKSKQFEQKRSAQDQEWLKAELLELFREDIVNRLDSQKVRGIQEQLSAVRSRGLLPATAARRILAELLGS